MPWLPNVADFSTPREQSGPLTMIDARMMSQTGFL
jgi:hypothetical protein|tara:strand:- start:8755 stop:8859 length:105 start_codon:yes stop_codon:yes gene_type:complete